MWATPSREPSRDIVDRGKWIDVTQDPTPGRSHQRAYTKRTPWYTETDFNLKQR